MPVIPIDQLYAQPQASGGIIPIDQMEKQDTATQPIESISTEGIGYIGKHPFKSVLQGLPQTITGETAQGMAEKNIPYTPMDVNAREEYKKNWGVYPSSSDEKFHQGNIGDKFKMLGGAGIDMASAPINAIVPGVGKLAGKVGEVAVPIISKMGENLNASVGQENLGNRIFGLYNEAVGVKAKNLGDISKVQPQRVNSLKAMSDNLPNVTLDSGESTPKSPWDLAQTLRQTKQNVFKKYNQLSGDATEAGAQIPMQPLVQKAFDDTVKSIGKDALTANPQLLNSIKQEAINANKIGITTPTRAEQYMKSLNNELINFRRSGQAVDYSVVDFKNNLIRHLNDATESTIEDTLSKSGYGDLRDQYAALKSSEKEILASANKSLRQQGGQGLGMAHPIANFWSLEQLIKGGAKAFMGDTAGAVKDVVQSGIIKGTIKTLEYMNSPDRKIAKMFELLKSYKGGINPGSGAVPVQAEIVGGTGFVPKGLNSPKPLGIPNKYSPSGPTIYGQNPVKGLPEPIGPNVRSGFDRPWENQGLPSPAKAGQSSGPIIKQGTSYKAPEKPVVDSAPKYGTDFAKQIKEQNDASKYVPLHPPKDAKEIADNFHKQYYPDAVPGNSNISKSDINDFNEMRDWVLSQNQGGLNISGGMQTGPERVVTSSPSGQSELFKKFSGNSSKEGFELLRKAANGEEMTTGQKFQLKQLVHEFRKMKG